MKKTLKNIKFLLKSANIKYSIYIKYIFFNLLFITISLLTPILTAKLIVSLTSNTLTKFLLFGIFLFILHFIREILTFFYSKLGLTVERTTMKNIQYKLGKEILKLESRTIEESGSGIFVQRLTNDTKNITKFFNNANYSLREIITTIGYFIAILIVNKYVFLYFLIMYFILCLMEFKRTNVVMNNEREYRKDNDKLYGFISEIVRGLNDIKMLNAEKSFTSKLKNKLENINKKKFEVENVNRIYTLYCDEFYFCIDLFFIIIVFILTTNKQLLLDDAVILFTYSLRLGAISYFLKSLTDMARDFNLSCERIIEILSDKFSVEKFGTKHLKKVDGNFEFKNVSFAYEKGQELLSDMSFKINANETVAFVGKSGVGKTTIFKLLCKMYKADKGEILIDGVNINLLDKDSIRGNITIISQDPYIFNMTIKENFEIIKEQVTMKEIKEACKTACLDEFINTLPNGYNTVIGEGGVNLSGGQKQRLAIARALVQKTEIILFDEATSSLDNETQDEINKAISNIDDEYTILIIAHRLSTIINADKIFYIEDGKVLDFGTHKELLKKCENYKKLYNKELKKQEYK